MSLSSAKNKKINEAFKLEKKRSKLAKKNDLSNLRKLYERGLPEIENNNTSILWDTLNKRDDLNINPNYMELDKLLWVSKNIKNNSKVLNIGFGSGNLEEILWKSNKSLDWEGIDISGKSVKTASFKFPSYKFKVSNIEKLDYGKDIFDTVVALEVLEHISPSKILKVLTIIQDTLKSGGVIIISVPLNENLKKMIKKGINPNAHVREYTEELILAELKMAGFDIKKTRLIYAFRRYYKFKSLIVNYLLKGIRHPNGIIIVAQKP